MRLGATLAHLSPGPPLAIADWAKRLVDAGFESLWVPQAVGRESFVADPFVTLAVAATATSGVEVGTATLQVPLHHPADLAYRIRSILDVCGDRLTLGVSPGSTEVDYLTFDRDFAARFRTFDQNLARLRTLLAPAPPLVLGSWGAKVERAAREFDGWLASGYRLTPDQIIAAHTRFRAAGGRRAIVCTVPVAGDPGSVREVLRRYAEAGFDDAVVLFEPEGPDPDQVRALFD